MADRGDDSAHGNRQYRASAGPGVRCAVEGMVMNPEPNTATIQEDLKAFEEWYRDRNRGMSPSVFAESLARATEELEYYYHERDTRLMFIGWVGAHASRDEKIRVLKAEIARLRATVAEFRELAQGQHPVDRLP
jgi:hypothetical protein